VTKIMIDKAINLIHVLASKERMVLRFIGFMYLVEPDIICSTISLFAFSDGWNGSQNTYKSLLGHKLEHVVHTPMPL